MKRNIICKWILTTGLISSGIAIAFQEGAQSTGTVTQEHADREYLRAIGEAQLRLDAAWPRDSSKDLPGANSVSQLDDEESLDSALAGGSLATLPTIEVEGELFWIAQGDLLLDATQLSDFMFELELAEAVHSAREFGRQSGRSGLHPKGVSEQERGELIADVDPVKETLIRWSPGKVLTYRIAKATFPSEEAYTLTRTKMSLACEDWEATCGVDFAHIESLDDTAGIAAEGADFAVRYITNTGSSGGLIASAFFPSDPVSRRRLLITPNFFSTTFDQQGVLRHELGHVLGFRHEHISKEAPHACQGESTSHTQVLTEYDSDSVMHYLCGGLGDPQLSITESDRIGARLMYGMPHQAYSYVE